MGSLFSPPVIGAGDYSAPIDFQPGNTLIVGTTPGGTGYSTIQAAVNAAGRGATILVQPGSYDENVTVTTDYLTIVGAQVSGYGRPDVVPSSGVALTVTAQGFVCRRMRFAATAADCVVQKGNGFKYEECVFDGDGTAAKAGLRLLPDDDDDSFTASEGRVAGSLFRGSANGVIFDTGAPPNSGVGSTDNVFEDNSFRDNTIDFATADTGGALYSVKKTQIGPRNVFGDKNKTTYIDLTTTNGGAASDQDGTICGNYFAADAITAGNEVKMVGTGFTFVGNYTTVGVKDGSGLD